MKVAVSTHAQMAQWFCQTETVDAEVIAKPAHKIQLTAYHVRRMQVSSYIIISA